MSKSDGSFSHVDGVDLRDLFTAQIDNIRTLINANDKNYNQRFDNVTAATNAALAASDRAVTKAELASEKRFDAVNEFRATLADQQRNLMPRNEVEIINNSLSERLEKIENRLILIEGKGVGIGQGMGYVIGIIGAIIGVVSFLINFAK